MSVETLLHQVKVSDIRPIPCTIKGTVRGKGVPGYILSDDLVLQDDTGIIFLDHRQPLAIWEWIWGWMRGDSMIGKEITVQGWYRRSPMPYIEINNFTVSTSEDGVVLGFSFSGASLSVGNGLHLLDEEFEAD